MDKKGVAIVTKLMFQGLQVSVIRIKKNRHVFKIIEKLENGGIGCAKTGKIKKKKLLGERNK